MLYTCVSLILQEGTNAIVVHFSPFYNILKEHSLAVLGAITEAATQAQDPLHFLLSKQGTDILVLNFFGSTVFMPIAILTFTRFSRKGRHTLH